MTGTRDRFVAATASLLSRRGYAATGLNQIAADSDARLGSLYHFFPKGKEELAEQALRDAGEGYLRLAVEFLDATPDLVEAVDEYFRVAADVLEQTDYVDACPIATVALEVASTNDRLRQVTADVFASWLDELDTRFLAAGLRPHESRELALVTLSALEGAFMLSRAAKSTEAMHAARRALTRLLRLSLAG